VPSGTVGLPGEIDTLVSVTDFTVKFVETGVAPAIVAVILVVPAVRAVANPFVPVALLIVAMAVFEEDHAVIAVMSKEVPLL